MTEAVQLKIELLGTQPLVWRSIHILANSTLRRLQATISDCFAWIDIYEYRFEVGEDYYGNLEIDNEWGWDDDERVKVGAIAKKHREFEYIYDFTSDWRHRITIEDVFPADSNESYPLCVGGECAAPPDGCGGPKGFAKLKSQNSITLRKPRNAMDAFFLERTAKGFDPLFFDKRALNEFRLTRRKVGLRRK